MGITASSVPVLLMVFNRPHETRKVFNIIRTVEPKFLYIAADGPRRGGEQDKAMVQSVRDIIAQVDWDCEVQTLLRNENLGCRVAVSSAIDWFFKHEEAGIILEDDCLPNLDFFPYCEELLRRYRQDDRVMMISGTTFYNGQGVIPYSYYFSRYHHIWGWATWRRAWKYYNGCMQRWPDVRDSGEFQQMILNNTYSEKLKRAQFLCWRKLFDKVYSDETLPWDALWIFACWLNNGLTVVPVRNMVSNIGFGDAATHTCFGGSEVSCLKTYKMRFPLKHPPVYFQNRRADILIQRVFFRIGLQIKLFDRVGRWQSRM